MRYVFPLLWLCLAACSGHKDQHADYEEAPQDYSEEIELSPEQAKAAGVKVQKVVARDFHEVIPVSGRILTASGDETTVSATASGIVRLVRPLANNQEVRSGATLFTISSRGMQEGDAAQKARIEYEAAKRQYNRDSQLALDRIVSEKHLDESRTALENARLAYEALGAGRGDGTPVSTPKGGYIKELLVKEGDYVPVGSPLLVLTRQRSLYLQANVPLRYRAYINRIGNATFRQEASSVVHNLRTLNGRKIGSGQTVSEGSHYLPITFQMDNHADLVAGAWAEVWLLSNERKGVICLPNTALTEEQGLYYVYVRDAQNTAHYHKVEVSLGATDGERTEITKGLKEGELVVTAGAMQVKMAAAKASIPNHSHEH